MTARERVRAAAREQRIAERNWHNKLTRDKFIYDCY